MEEANLIQFAQGKQLEQTDGPAKLYSSCPRALRYPSVVLPPTSVFPVEILSLMISQSQRRRAETLCLQEFLHVSDRDSLRLALSLY